MIEEVHNKHWKKLVEKRKQLKKKMKETLSCIISEMEVDIASIRLWRYFGSQGNFFEFINIRKEVKGIKEGKEEEVLYYIVRRENKEVFSEENSMKWQKYESYEINPRWFIANAPSNKETLNNPESNAFFDASIFPVDRVLRDYDMPIAVLCIDFKTNREPEDCLNNNKFNSLANGMTEYNETSYQIGLFNVQKIYDSLKGFHKHLTDQYFENLIKAFDNDNDMRPSSILTRFRDQEKPMNLPLAFGTGKLFKVLKKVEGDLNGSRKRKYYDMLISKYAIEEFEKDVLNNEPQNVKPIIFPCAKLDEWENLRSKIYKLERHYIPSEDRESVRIITGSSAYFLIFSSDNRKRIIGVLYVGSRNPQFFTWEHRLLLDMICQDISLLYERLIIGKKEEEKHLRDVKDKLIFTPNDERINIFNLNEAKGCVYFDLDEFKKINDTFTHETGDKVIREIKIALLIACGIECGKFTEADLKKELNHELKLVKDGDFHYTKLKKDWDVLPLHLSGDEFAIAIKKEIPGEEYLDLVRKIGVKIQEQLLSTFKGHLSGSGLAFSMGLCVVSKANDHIEEKIENIVKHCSSENKHFPSFFRNFDDPSHLTKWSDYLKVAELYMYKAKKIKGSFIYAPEQTVTDHCLILKNRVGDTWMGYYPKYPNDDCSFECKNATSECDDIGSEYENTSECEDVTDDPCSKSKIPRLFVNSKFHLDYTADLLSQQDAWEIIMQKRELKTGDKNQKISEGEEGQKINSIEFLETLSDLMKTYSPVIFNLEKYVNGRPILKICDGCPSWLLEKGQFRVKYEYNKKVGRIYS